ncbi:MAG: imidazolonepropionase [Flammeovirgaceae bacterium]
MKPYTLIGPFAQLATMAEMPLKGALKDEEMPLLKDAGLLLKGDKIEAIGNFEELKAQTNELDVELVELDRDYVCVPGFVDAHTHICFGGSRANDYAMRNAGKSYLEIAKAGGGIWDSVKHTRQACLETLVAGIKQRATRHLQSGITTIEVKSGYGLSVAEELKMLRAIKVANVETEADLIPTCLAAHVLPKDFEGDHAAYLAEISTHLFPQLKAENLTSRIDAFIEEEAFSAEIVAPYFQKAKELGFDLTVHADQFSTSGSEVAVNFGALSADHLEASGEKEVAMLAKSEVIAMALPGASIGLGCAFTPARKVLDAGGCVAIASDWNPGSAPMGDLLCQAAILGTFQKLSNAEVLAGITYRAAAALKLTNRGRLQKGYLADFSLFPTANINEILYQQGQLKPEMVWKAGRAVAKKQHTASPSFF